MTSHPFSASSWLLAIAVATGSQVATAQQAITLEQAVMMAQQNDPWLHGNRLKQQAIENKSVASGALPDPQVSLGLMNLPVDTWEFEQEGMTQVKVGVTQMFPRGDSLQLKQSQLALESSQYPLLRANRKAQLQSKVSELWLDAYLAQRTIELIKGDRALFEQIAEVAMISYSNVIGKTRQQDVIRAELEIVQLEDRLTVEKQKLDTLLAQLNEWLHIYDKDEFAITFDDNPSTFAFEVSNQLPTLQLLNAELLKASDYSRQRLAGELAYHPALMAIDVKQQVSEKGVQLAEQSYKPQWGVNASYGYRGDMPSGDSRADFFSVGVTFDLPIFTENNQDKQVAASVAESESVKTEKLLLLKQMISAVEKELKQLKRLSDRKALYGELLLKQTQEQAEASLNAYTNDDGDFAEVVRARIAVLNARISALNIDVNLLKTVARINYFMARYQPQQQTNSQSIPTYRIGEE
ncbi:TolC family protein [Pseudoalteromonas sp. T1lg75]|uniref:TolC family protein n=1 Tax=Pseudoalteromonas sp. T1lg75 TaxID=2077102 RepID=UPI000CF6F003|nr:TolC family protein [Pseudoalteromonas sp. T1lg75]